MLPHDSRAHAWCSSANSTRSARPPKCDAIADAIPHAEFVEFPNAGHMTTMENPAAVNDSLLRFIDCKFGELEDRQQLSPNSQEFRSVRCADFFQAQLHLTSAA